MAKTSRDFETYEKSKDLLKERIRGLYLDKTRTYVISISRKGPKLLEHLFRDEPDILEMSNTLTEYGLPFLFHRLGKEKGDKYNLCLVDDAIYYGTTMDCLTRIVSAYAKLFRVKHEPLHCYAAIRDKASSPLLKDVIAYDEARPGFGHYFIKQLTSDIRLLHNTFEVEYPSVRFNLSDVFDSNTLLRAFTDVYGQNNVYLVQHLESESINILLPNVNASLFNKLRIYPDYKNHSLYVTCLAPRVIENWGSDIEDLFIDTPIESLWQLVLEESELPSISDFELVDGFVDIDRLEQDRNRCLVVLANYLLSFSTLIQQKDQLQHVFEQLADSFHYVGIVPQHVYYLTANRSLSSLICAKLAELYQSGIPYSSQVVGVEEKQNSIAYSGPDGMTDEDLAVLDNQNRLLLMNSTNLQEALSALAFNQTILVEKRMRRIGFYDPHRLHFGYTFGALMADVQKYASFELGDDAIIAMHKWVDRRIDKGCLVPQYIETESGSWLRVFRPGENEDEILSHLARFALFVFNLADAELRLGWLPQEVFAKLLSISYFQFDSLADSLGIPLMLRNGSLFFKNDDQKEYRNLLDYLIRMRIFTVTNDKVRISPRLVDEELMQYTTLDSDVEEKVSAKLVEVLKDFKRSNVALDQAFLVFNYYLYNSIDRMDATNAVRQVVVDTLNAIEGWDPEVSDEELRFEYWNEVHEGYINLANFVICNRFLLSEERMLHLTGDEIARQRIISEQTKINSLILELEILLSIFLIDDESLTKDVLNDIANPSENPRICIADTVIEYAKSLLYDYNSEVKRRKLLQVISVDLSNFLNDK